LLKRHEKEINANAVQKVTIDRIRAELNDLESKCKKLEKEKLDLLQKQTKFDYNKKTIYLMNKLKDYRMKYKKCLNELKCFDEKFFEEIEDIKYYLQESLKLNEYYENLLHIANGEGKKMSEKYKKLKIFDNKNEVRRSSIDLVNSLKSSSIYSTINENENDDDDERFYESDNEMSSNNEED